jgi:hypothetical protein
LFTNENDAAALNECQQDCGGGGGEETCLDAVTGKNVVSGIYGCSTNNARALCGTWTGEVFGGSTMTMITWLNEVNCPYGCLEGGVCRDKNELTNCNDFYKYEVNSLTLGCSKVDEVSLCQDDGTWSSNISNIKICDVSERCFNGKCEKISCSGEETVSPNQKGCVTTSSSAVCLRDSTTGKAMWGNINKCDSGICEDGACVAEEIKCTLCADGHDRSRGDADCDGVVTLNDWALWFKEFESGKGTEEKNNWSADFVCDGKVDKSDLNRWFTNYMVDQRK